MTGATGQELELKLELTPGDLQRVKGHPALRGLAVGEPTTRTLRSIYFDTPDHRLRAAGISLRARWDGAGWLQTVKSGTVVTNGVSQPVEIETTVPEPKPDLGAISDNHLRRRIARLTRGSLLEAAFETIVTRTARQLHTNSSDLELALDEGVVRTSTAKSALCEAELELKAGTAEALLTIATELFADVPTRLAEISKAERGYDLLLGHTQQTPRPRHADDVELPDDATCGEALVQFVESAGRQIVANRQVLETDDPEGAHQLRVGLRRLRSALRAFRSIHDTTATRALNERARVVARAVGELRDADVLLETLYPEVAAKLTGHPGLEPLRSALRDHRRDKRELARAALADQQWSTLQLSFALWPRAIADDARLDQPLAGFAGKALAKAWKPVATKGKRLDGLDRDERHELRKSLRNCATRSSSSARSIQRARCGRSSRS